MAMNRPVVDVGESVRTLRRARRLSQAELAKAAGISSNLVSRVERGATNFRRATLEVIAKALKTDVASLMSGAGPMPSRDDDPATRRLLMMWHGLSAEHRPAALDALAHVVALAATMRTLQARLEELEDEARRYEVRRGRSTLEGQEQNPEELRNAGQEPGRRHRRQRGGA